MAAAMTHKFVCKKIAREEREKLAESSQTNTAYVAQAAIILEHAQAMGKASQFGFQNGLHVTDNACPLNSDPPLPLPTLYCARGRDLYCSDKEPLKNNFLPEEPNHTSYKERVKAECAHAMMKRELRHEHSL